MKTLNTLFFVYTFWHFFLSFIIKLLFLSFLFLFFFGEVSNFCYRNWQSKTASGTVCKQRSIFCFLNGSRYTSGNIKYWAQVVLCVFPHKKDSYSSCFDFRFYQRGTIITGFHNFGDILGSLFTYLCLSINIC